MGKEDFKSFAKGHPNLAGYVANGEMTWQKFYEMYDMYGEKSVIWDPYQKYITSTENIKQPIPTKTSKSDMTLKDVFNMVKGLDLTTMQKGIDGVQKAIGMVQDLTGKSAPGETPNTYEPRPMYKYFED